MFPEFPVPEYPVRDPAECATVRRVAEGDWMATDADGRSARGPTPAAAISTLRR